MCDISKSSEYTGSDWVGNNVHGPNFLNQIQNSKSKILIQNSKTHADIQT